METADTYTLAWVIWGLQFCAIEGRWVADVYVAGELLAHRRERLLILVGLDDDARVRLEQAHNERLCRIASECAEFWRIDVAHAHRHNRPDAEPAVDAQLQGINDSIMGEANPRVKARLGAKMPQVLGMAEIDAKQEHFRKKHDKARGDADIAIAQLTATAAAETNPANRQGITRMLGDLLGTMKASNYYTDKEVADKAQAFLKDTDKARAGALLFKNPKLLKAIVETDEGKKQFPNLKAEELYSLGQKASELMKEREQEGVAAEKARVEKVNQEMLVAITAPGASLVTLREQVRARVGKDLNAKDGEHWIDNIDKMIKSREKEPKERDPFKTSDSATLARVMAGVINEPDKWDSEKITAMMGNGLSVPHALRAVAMLDKANKDPAGTLTPMKQAQQTWNRLQSDFAFVPTEERQRGNPEAITKNSREAQKIFDQVQARADRGEDPRVVLEELMQPHYDEKIKGFFDKDRWFPSYSREEGIKAKQELIRRGLQPTDEAVNSTVEALRRANNPYAAGPATFEGRAVVKNPDGTWSHERTITIEAGGKHMNIPTMFGGKEVPPDKAVEIMRKNNWVDPDTGKKVPTFTSQKAAVEAAEKKEARQQRGGKAEY